MIDLVHKTIGLNAKDRRPITEWRVLFSTPFGLMEDLDEAVKRCRDSDLDPHLFVKPAVVAFSGRDYEPAG